MKGKVTCQNCGHSWNKSDSSEKDKHVCHNCGKSDVNMKNGGWLDNYNDSEVSVPEGFQGDGFSNVGRNYSPAWGGQFQNGGTKKKVLKTADKVAEASVIGKILDYIPGAETLYDLKNTVNSISEGDYKGIASNTIGSLLPGISGKAIEAVAEDWMPPTPEIEKSKMRFNLKSSPAERMKYLEKYGPGYLNNPQFIKDFKLQEGGSINDEEAAMRGMMKSKIGMGNAFNHPAIKRMSQAMPKTGMTPEGEGTHYMSSMDNYAVPLLQDKGNNWLDYYENPAPSSEDIRFNRPEDAQYFAEHYKEVAPMSTIFKGLNNFQTGGFVPPKSHYKRLYEHAKDYTQGENKNMKIDPDTGYSYFPTELSTSQQTEVPNNPWNISRFLFDPFILNSSQGIHNSKYDEKGNIIDTPGKDIYEEGHLLPINSNRAERYNAAKKDITSYYKEDLKQDNNSVDKNVNDVMSLVRRMRRADEMMQRHNATYKDFQNPENIFKSAVGFNELFPAESIVGDFEFNPSQAKRAYKMFQKTWRGVSGKEARQNSREELKKAKEAFELAEKQIKEGLPAPDPNYIQEEFQTGGSLPGSVGFTYARTQGIPSEGPYAKKTMPSAQAGRKIKIKDEREESFKPSESTGVKRKDFDLEQSKANKAYINAVAAQKKETARRAKLTKDQREREDYNAYNEERGSISKYTPETTWQRTKAFVSNPLTAAGYVTRGENLPGNFQAGPRNTHDYALDWINPLQGAVALSEIPGELSRGEYLNAGLSGLDALDLGVYARGAKNALEPAVKKGMQHLGNIKTRVSPELKQGLQTNGLNIPIIDEMEDVVKFISEKFDRSNLESSSGNQWLKDWYADDIIKKRLLKFSPKGKLDKLSSQKFLSQEDFENLQNLRNMQKYHSYAMSSNPFYNDPNIYDFKEKNYTDLLKEQGLTDYLKRILTTGGVNYGGSPEHIYHNKLMYYPFDKKGLESIKVHEGTHAVNNNGDMFGSEEVEELLKPFGESLATRSSGYSKPSLFNMKPYYTSPTEIHARMNQSRFENNLQPKDIFTEEHFNNSMSKNKFNGMGKYIKDKDAFIKLMNNFYTPAAVIGLGAASQMEEEPIPGMRHGGIIKDDRGQWDHPGEITEINSNDITMEGVPYPVLGISDTGDTKLMQPGKNYKFKGKKVTEFPMAKNGVNQADENSLVKLNQLTNFTNYNKPQPGIGWLSKYE